MASRTGYNTAGRQWKKHRVTSDRVLRRMQVRQKSSPELWRQAQDIVRLSIEKGYLAES